MSFAIEIHSSWRNLRVNIDDAQFARRFRLLSQRQQRILRYRAEGMRLGEIARATERSEQTTKNNLTAIYRVLNTGQYGEQSIVRIAYLLGRMDGANGR